MAKKPRTVGVVEPRVVVKIPWTKIGSSIAKKTTGGGGNPSSSSQGSLKQMPMMMLTPDPNFVDHQENAVRHYGFPCRKEVYTLVMNDESRLTGFRFCW